MCVRFVRAGERCASGLCEGRGGRRGDRTHLVDGGVEPRALVRDVHDGRALPGQNKHECVKRRV
jgi:hypothetical protein